MDRSRQSLTRNSAHRVMAGVVAAIIVMSLGFLFWPKPAVAPVTTSPAAYEPPWWVNAAGGDTPITSSQLATLRNPSNSDLGPSDYKALANLGASGAKAQLSGENRGAFGSYFAGSAPALCTGVHVLAVSPVRLPVNTPAGVNTTNWSKILVVYNASCTGSTLGSGSDEVMFLYANLGTNWKLVHEYQVPGSQNADPSSNVSPASWQMTNFSSCAGPTGETQRDVIVVVKAFDLMCQAAARDGVSLSVTAGWRSATQQAALYQEAVKFYGSAAKARQYVAYATASSCTSLHCAGVAVDVAPTKKALGWLYTVVGCVSGTHVALGPSHCTSSSPILQMERYGFGGPAPQVPEYLTYILPTTSSSQNCNPGSATPVPVMVAQIWRCVLAENSVSVTTIKAVVAKAEVVSLCESGWNANAYAYGGKWASTPDPSTGKTITNQGVFMLSLPELHQYGRLGTSGLDPVVNISAAAQLWVSSRSFAAFGCATGHGLFVAGPVLPEYGGPPVPTWAYAY